MWDVIILKFYVGVLKGKANNVLVMLIKIFIQVTIKAQSKNIKFHFNLNNCCHF